MNVPLFRRYRGLFSVSVLALSLGLFVGCGKKEEVKATDARHPKPVSRKVEAEAENAMSDAAFAVQIKDFARAETSVSQAVALRDDIPEWWITLGSLQKKLGKLDDAKGSYKKALAIHERAYSRSKEPQAMLEQVYVLLLLGREKDARSLLDKGLKAHPENAQLQGFAKGKGIEQLLAEPQMRENKL